ncbi:MAG: alkaline phosphatase family protein [Opitutaceae bacterium]|jgi:arylsulfatase A-like enzyme|nr:alkaline phosphatase family protein [Opitutaceae bacterium]
MIQPRFTSLLLASVVVISALDFGLPSAFAAKEVAAATPRPRLIVGLVVDQMRQDYLYRFQDRYGPDGFRRLLADGFSCDATYINYLPTVTAIGHASVYTGSVPAIHGMTGNDFIIEKTGKRRYCVQDDTVKPVGGASSGGLSPRNLLSNTITDELKLATHFRSKIIGVALKDRGSILPAGHAADSAWWFDDATGEWVTSTFYMEKRPTWVDDFNAQKNPDTCLAQGWNLLYPPETYRQSTPDQNPYERALDLDPAANTFPIDLKTLSAKAKKPYGVLRPTPHGNTLTLDFARAAIKAERLGQNPSGYPDFLAISLSSTDAAGHIYGTNSPKMEDLYLRLDRDLAAFLTWLDERIGQGQYLLFLTADHGAAHNAQFLADHKIPSGAWSARNNAVTLKLNLNQTLARKHGVSGLVRDISNYRVCLNTAAIREKSLDERAIRADCAAFLREVEGVAWALDIDEVHRAPIPALLRERIINGYHPARSGVVQLILEPGWYAGTPAGTTHGAWNPYDAHIPLQWFGWGIKPGRTSRTVNITDIAPTLAALLKIQPPNGCIGQSITEVLGE